MSGFKVKDRNPRNKWFITFPHSGNVVLKNEFIEKFEENFPTKRYAVVEEKHKDGEPHIHALVETEGKVNKTSLLDWAKKNFEGNEKRLDFEGVKSWKAALDYITVPGTYGAKGKEKKKNEEDLDKCPLIKGIDIGSKEERIMRKRHYWWTSFGGEIGCCCDWKCTICKKENWMHDCPGLECKC